MAAEFKIKQEVFLAEYPEITLIINGIIEENDDKISYSVYIESEGNKNSSIQKEEDLFTKGDKKLYFRHLQIEDKKIHGRIGTWINHQQKDARTLEETRRDLYSLKRTFEEQEKYLNCYKGIAVFNLITSIYFGILILTMIL